MKRQKTIILLASALTVSAIIIGAIDLLVVNMFSQFRTDSDVDLVSIYQILILLVARQIFIAAVSFLSFRTSSLLVDASISDSVNLLFQNIIPTSRFDSKFATTFGVKSAFVYPFIKSYSSIVTGCSSFLILFVAICLEVGSDFIIAAGIGAFAIAVIFVFLRYTMDYLSKRYQQSQGYMNDLVRISPRHISNLVKNFSERELSRLKARSSELRFLEMAQDFVATLPKFFMELLIVFVVTYMLYHKYDFLDFALLGVGYASFRLVAATQMILNGVAIYRFNLGIVNVFRDKNFFLEDETMRGELENKLNHELVVVGENSVRSLLDFRSEVVDAHKSKFILIGESGMGKSLFTRTLQVNLINRGNGCAFVDSNLFIAEQGISVCDLFSRFFSENPNFDSFESKVTAFIEEIWNSDVQSLSLGQRMRLNVFFYILLGYRSLILDEVLSTLDLDNKILLFEFLKSIDLDLLIVVDHNISQLDFGLPVYRLEKIKNV